MALSMNKKIEKELRALPGNNVCCDCDERNPQWASVPFGVFMCLECSGRHRALGVHISFVRSVSMDSWTEKQIEMMRGGGNDKCIAFLQSHDVPKTMPIPQKYNTSVAMLYRERLSAQVEGRPIPTELPASATVSPSTSTKSLASKSPHEMNEAEQKEWIEEQNRLREEAKERMRLKFGGSAGLTSSGKMAGLGSDPNYRAESTTSNVDLADVSQKTLDFFSSTWSSLSETVVKSTQQLLQEGQAQPAAASADGSAAPSAGTASWQPNTEELKEELGKTWNLLSTGAVNFWKQAQEMTTEVLSTMTPNDPNAPHHLSDSGKEGMHASPSATSMSSWDSLSDIKGEQPVTMSARRPVAKEEKTDFFSSFGV